MRLDLGGGLAPAPGHVNIDLIPESDIQWDLNKGLPLAGEVVEYDPIGPQFAKVRRAYRFETPVEGIRASHVIEHLDTIIPLMNDCYEVLKSGGLFEISTPLAGTDQYWQDPTHKRGYVMDSFLYFAKDSPFAKEQKEYGITARFIIVSNYIEDHWQLCATLKKP